MKADHRKELQTNVLADRMGRMVQGLRSGGPRSMSAIAWVIGGLALVAIVSLYWAMGQRNNLSEAWVKMDNQAINLPRNPGEPGGEAVTYDAIIREHPGTVPARTARFQVARIKLKTGLSGIYSEAFRGEAAKLLRDAREQFTKLAAECQGVPILEQEALLGAAKAEETLAGVAEPDSEDKRMGNLDEALKLYQRLAAKFPGTYEGQAAEKRAKELQDEGQRAQIDKFYKEMSQMTKRQFPPPMPMDQAPPPMPVEPREP